MFTAQRSARSWRMGRGGIILCCLLLALTACGQQQPTTSQSSAPTPPPASVQAVVEPGLGTAPQPPDGDDAKSSDCPNLSSLLRDLSESPDGLSQALALGLSVDADRILVEIHLAGSDTSNLAQYDATITGQSDSVVQALVPLKNLCLLAQDAQVAAVREAMTAQPMAP